MTRDCRIILDNAVALCRQEAGCRLKIMFGLGQQVLRLERVGGKFRKSDQRGLCRGDAIALLRTHCQQHAHRCGYSIPNCGAYWYCGALAVDTWTAIERNILVRYNTPWIEMSYLLALKDHGRDLIRQLAAGQIKAIRLRKRTRQAGGSILHSENDWALTEFCIRGDESEEALQNMLENMLATIVRLHYDPERMTAVALRRVRRAGDGL